MSGVLLIGTVVNASTPTVRVKPSTTVETALFLDGPLSLSAGQTVYVLRRSDNGAPVIVGGP